MTKPKLLDIYQHKVTKNLYQCQGIHHDHVRLVPLDPNWPFHATPSHSELKTHWVNYNTQRSTTPETDSQETKNAKGTQ